MSSTTEDSPKGVAAPDDVAWREIRTMLGGLVRTARPRQWMKNVLVLAAPLAAGQLTNWEVLIDVAMSFTAFCLVASAVYLVNDAIDVKADRVHPTKRNRPIAAGVVGVRHAYTASSALFLTAVNIALLTSWQLVVVVVVYAVSQLGYCLGLKHQPVVDLCIVASGFLLRSIAGGAAAGIPLSQWFLLVTAFGSLFMVSGKRYAEIILFERTGSRIRASLAKYSASYLRFVWATSAAIVIMSYTLWALEIRLDTDGNSVWSVISIVPFVVAVLRYAVDVDGGEAGEPEHIALSDRILQFLGLTWISCLTLSVYL